MSLEIVQRAQTRAQAGWPLSPDPRFPPSVYYRFLYWLAFEMQAKTAVELGVCGGGGSRALAEGLKDQKGFVFGVDIDHAWDARMDELVRELPNFQFYFGDAVESAKIYAERWPAEPLDILFIDTTHTDDQTSREVNAWKGLLSDRAVIVLDDTFRPGMMDAIKKIQQENPGWTYVELDNMHIGAGFGALVR